MTHSLILGLDTSARRIGWCIVAYETAEVIYHGTQHTPAGNDLANRRIAFKEIAYDADKRGDVCAVFIEDAYSGPSRQGTIQHASSVGNVEAFALNQYPFILVDRIAPSTWRSVLGLPSSGKEPVMEWATKTSPFPVKTQDEADAIAIATTGHHLIWKEKKAA